MSNVTVYYYAMLRDEARKGEENIGINVGETAAHLYEKLKSKYFFELDRSQLRVAINEEFADFDMLLKAGDRIAFIPPVAGG